jgi:tetratricopeptide (TPR) repeat protein
MADLDQASAQPDSARIDGWKRIAAYLERDKSTVKRWEASRGLPIRRLPGPRGPVYAFKHELTAWLAAHKEADLGPVAAPPPSAEPPSAAHDAQRQAPRRSPTALMAVAAGAAFILGAALWIQAPGGAHLGAPDPVANALYLRARESYEMRTPSSLASALSDLDAAVARDPRFAGAYAALADTWLLMPEYTTTPPGTGYARAEAAAKTALRLDPDNAGAYAALGYGLYWRDRDLAGARREFERALRLAPNDAQSHHWLANILDDAGLGEPALAEIDRASALDPASASIAADRGAILARRDPQAGMRLLRDLVALQPNNRSGHYYLAYYALPAGSDGEYLDHRQRVAQLVGDAGGQALVAKLRADYARGGRRAMLEGLLADARARGDALDQAHALALLGRDDEAMASLRRAVASYQWQGIGLAADPYLVGLRGNPEFRTLAAQALQGK